MFVGSLHPRKNILNLIKAFSLFKKESESDVKLLLAGPIFWGLADINKVIQDNQLKDDIVFTGRQNDEDLALILGSAMALTFIPYYEGFGIPLIEAMQAQVPIIASNATSIPEVCGDAALLVNPFDVQDIKQAMLHVFASEDIRNGLIKKGQIQKQKFSWDKSADLLWQSILNASQTTA